MNAPHLVTPRVINVDKNAAYTKALEEIKDEEQLPASTGLRPSKYCHKLIEQDHRAIKRLTRPMLGFQSFPTARRTLRGMEAMPMIRKGQIHGVAKGDIVAQRDYIAQLFGVAA